jgi:hypothetical protein
MRLSRSISALAMKKPNVSNGSCVLLYYVFWNPLVTLEKMDNICDGTTGQVGGKARRLSERMRF